MRMLSVFWLVVLLGCCGSAVGAEFMLTKGTITSDTALSGQVNSLNGVYSSSYGGSDSVVAGIYDDPDLTINRSIRVFDPEQVAGCRYATRGEFTFEVTDVREDATQIRIRIAAVENPASLTDEEMFVLFGDELPVPENEDYSIFVADLEPGLGTYTVEISNERSHGNPLQRVQQAIQNGKKIVIGVKVKGVVPIGTDITIDGPSYLSLTFEDGRPLSSNINRHIDKAFPKASVLGTPLSALLQQAVNTSGLNLERIRRRASFAADSIESSELDLFLSRGVALTGKAPQTALAASAVELADDSVNYVEYDPEEEEITVNQEGFTDGMLPLHVYTTSNGEISHSTGVDMRPAQTLIYGKKITPSNIADTVAAAIPSVDIAVGSESSNEVIVTLTLQDLSEDAIAQDQVFEAWLSEAPLATVDLDTDPDWITSTAASGGLAADTGTILETITTGKRLRGEFDAGVFELSITHTSAKTWYLNVLLNDRLYSSGVITFT